MKKVHLPQKMVKVKLVINHADPGSSVTLRSSVEALKEQANAEIPGLAENQFVKKVVYNGYTKGERNLGVNVHLEQV